MIRFIHCIKARPDITPESFWEFWFSAPFRQLLSELTVQAGTREIRRDLTLNVEANLQLQMEHQAPSPYDAILEIWFDDATSLQRPTSTSEMQALLNRIEQLQADFIDFQSSRRFFTEWEDVCPYPR
jgi:hypothetical protein